MGGEERKAAWPDLMDVGKGARNATPGVLSGVPDDWDNGGWCGFV